MTTSCSRRRPKSGCRPPCSCSAWTSRVCRTKRDMPERATVLAFDCGLKRIGVAVGEPELRSAHPLPAVSEFPEIEKLIDEWKPAKLVVGLPVRDAGEHPLAKRVEKFARRL